MKIKVLSILMWLILTILGGVGSFGLNLTKVQADVLPQVQFATSSMQGSEKSAYPQIDITLSKEATTDVTIGYEIDSSASTAINGINYLSSSNSVIIPEGKMTGSIPLQIIDDKTFSIDKVLVFNLLTVTDNAVLNLDPTMLTLVYNIVEDNTPTTFLMKDPAAAKGTNGWFLSQPSITLTADRLVNTYYQWDGMVTGQWLTYTDSFRALEGDHTLYFYSADGNGFDEMIQSETIKVDTVAPAKPKTTLILNSQNQVQINWFATRGAVIYEVWRSDGVFSKIATLKKSQFSFIDQTFQTFQTVQAGKTYRYKVIAIDAAGHKTKSEIMTATVPALIVEQPAQSVQTVSSPPQKFILSATTKNNIAKPVAKKMVGVGASTVENSIKEPVSLPADVSQNTETESESRNWNKLLLAVSLLIIASGVLIGAYYGYGWYVDRKEISSENNNRKNKSRW